MGGFGGLSPMQTFNSRFLMSRLMRGLLNGDKWLKSPEEWRIGVERHAVAVATARYD